MANEIVFCRGGGCTAKLGPAALARVLEKLPRPTDPNLLIGAESSDDAAVYRLTDDLAIVQTLDFFPPMVEDPYIFGQVAATNALSDVYAMGGRVVTALNIVCFPESWDLNILGRILQGGSEKVTEAGGSLAGGHSIADSEVKYGLSVTGVVHPAHIRPNNGGHVGDKLLLTKPLGVGLTCTAARAGADTAEAMELAVRSMTTLNRYAAEAADRYTIHACTDVTGFGLLGHLHEMLRPDLSARICADALPHIPQARFFAEEFYLTAAAQRNRNAAEGRVRFRGADFATEELVFDPQTSGGLLFAVAADDADALLRDVRALGLPCGIIGELLPRLDTEIIVEGTI
ncbi:MAG: selenide, water dikinase SelD [Butyricicoccus sp.]|nr:selenide, water dikinase SelD [Butyricicoccus sp.]